MWAADTLAVYRSVTRSVIRNWYRSRNVFERYLIPGQRDLHTNYLGPTSASDVNLFDSHMISTVPAQAIEPCTTKELTNWTILARGVPLRGCSTHLGRRPQ